MTFAFRRMRIRRRLSGMERRRRRSLRRRQADVGADQRRARHHAGGADRDGVHEAEASREACNGGARTRPPSTPTPSPCFPCSRTRRAAPTLTATENTGVAAVPLHRPHAPAGPHLPHVHRAAPGRRRAAAPGDAGLRAGRRAEPAGAGLAQACVPRRTRLTNNSARLHGCFRLPDKNLPSLLRTPQTSTARPPPTTTGRALASLTSGGTATPAGR
eukprot:SAG11_NODE_1117_length_5798_cov_10.203194_3_plen_216_part_00